MKEISYLEDGKIDKEFFLELIQKYKRLNAESEDKDICIPIIILVMAFISMGGETDGSGSISADKVRKVIKEEFQMTVDIDVL